MRKYCFQSRNVLVVLFSAFLFSNSSFAQPSSNIKDYVLFGGKSSCTNCSVQIGTSSIINGGSIGSYNLVKTTGNATLNTHISSGGRVEFSNNNTVTGNIAAANFGSASGIILQAVSGFSITGNADVKGNISISSGTVNGKVTHPAGTTYTGPRPSGGDIIAPPQLPGMPALPTITTFAAAGTGDITGTQSVSPGGVYGSIKLGGNKTLTFDGPGTYVFRSIANSGGFNTFVFNFQGKPGQIRIYVHGDVDVNKINIDFLNGGDASRVYTEVHGTGSTSADGVTAWTIANGASGTRKSEWFGTVWAPYGAINVGSGTSESKVTGALWSGTQVNIQSNVTITYVPFACTTTNDANAGADQQVTCSNPSAQLSGSSSTTGAQYSWTALNGGNITAGADTRTPTVSGAGTYVLAVTGSDCIIPATDTVVVTQIPCIIPSYTPPATGKVTNIIGSELTSLYLSPGTQSNPSPDIFITNGDSVMIEVIVLQPTGNYQTLLTTLQSAQYGLRVPGYITNDPASMIITGMYPRVNLDKLNTLTTLIDYCRPLYPAVSNAGVALTQGDSAVLAGFIRNGYGLQGEGIKVGVLSDSYNLLEGNPAQRDAQNDDLPGVGNIRNNTQPVEVLLESPWRTGTDEGRAMLQIIHDIAPKAQLGFRTGFISSLDFAQGIKQMQLANYKVITDDITYITEPFFQDGRVAQAVDYVKSQGVTYVSAAGNFGTNSYQNLFNGKLAPNNISGFAHEFSTGDFYQKVSLKTGTYTIVLQWQDNFYSLGQSSGAQNDLDIYLTNNNGATLFGLNRNNIGRDPIEVLSFTVTENTTTNIMIINATGNTNVLFKYIVFRGQITIDEYLTGTSTIVGQANALGSITVGATLFSNTPAFGTTPPTIASFSSRGGTPVNGTTRNKPDVTGPNGVNTTVFLNGQNIDGDSQPNFFGTSAAAPHVAGVAALLIQAKQKFQLVTPTPNDIKNLLQSTAYDMDVPGLDLVSGAGFIRADAAIRSFALPKPIITSLEIPANVTPGTQAFTAKVKGNFMSPGTKILLNGTVLSSTYVSTTEMTAQVPAFTSNPPVQAYS
ncbi:MAG: S8 family serine peptidase, partial [Flavisolibacter sp.]|nr:S8 family serine peptidase [Flavisolibacter sp.]